MDQPLYTTRPADALGADALAELALDLRWSFNHAADDIWSRLAPELWEQTHNPWFVLQTVSPEKLRRVMVDEAFREQLDSLRRGNRLAAESSGWFRQTHPGTPLTSVAYFSMEFMLSEALPIYSGGLGNVAGDQLKAASNLDVPVVAVGLLYQLGYFRQDVDAQGHQQELYPFNDPGQLPIRPLRGANGEWLRLSVAVPGGLLWIRAWEVRVGRRTLYLLDTNDPVNTPAQRGITSELYGGGPEMRLKQEIVLGIGGWRLLRAMGFTPEVCHLNEGHAAFAVLERARSFMADARVPFAEALTVTRAGNVFTTHTSVSAAFDRFGRDLMEKHLAAYAERELEIPLTDLLALGRRDPRDAAEPFNMAYLAVRGSGRINGVSRLHGRVARRMFQPMFPRWPEAEVPVAHVTNGVHMPTWDSAEADRIWEEACGKERWRWVADDMEAQLRSVADQELWRLRARGRTSLVEYVRKRMARQLAEQGAAPDQVARASALFDPDVLTVGFARRFSGYKRPNLLLRDPERLVRILTDARRPVQLVVAGKAHPVDTASQALVLEWNAFVRRPDVRARAVFLNDYDMLMAERLVQGVDLWFNTPRRPWEACGTSGMKVLVNGGLNLSSRDGWWDEAYSPEVGWAIGGDDTGDDLEAVDARDAEELYTLLEREVVPDFYHRNAAGIPSNWVSRMRESMARLTPRFSASRTVREYTEHCYLPAAAAYLERAADGGRAGAAILDWQAHLAHGWEQVRFGAVTAAGDGATRTYRAEVHLAAVDPETVRVEVYAEGDPPVRQPMTRVGPWTSPGSFVYEGAVPATRPPGDYTPRIVPCRAGAMVPLEAPWIRWHDPRTT